MYVGTGKYIALAIDSMKINKRGTCAQYIWWMALWLTWLSLFSSPNGLEAGGVAAGHQAVGTKLEVLTDYQGFLSDFLHFNRAANPKDLFLSFCIQVP